MIEIKSGLESQGRARRISSREWSGCQPSPPGAEAAVSPVFFWFLPIAEGRREMGITLSEMSGPFRLPTP